MKGQQKQCDFYGCNKIFVQSKRGHRFCSNSCRVKNNNVKHGRDPLPDFNSMPKRSRLSQMNPDEVIPANYDVQPEIQLSNVPMREVYSTIKSWFGGGYIASGAMAKIGASVAANTIIIPLVDRMAERMLSVNSLNSQLDILNAQRRQCELILLELENGVFPAGKIALGGVGFGVGKALAPKKGIWSFLIPVATTLSGVAILNLKKKG